MFMNYSNDMLIALYFSLNLTLFFEIIVLNAHIKTSSICVYESLIKELNFLFK